ncbi:hypothetical protein AWW66_04395 [Micromonospora rosaria]|uniref:Uncharacterized protein n=2 Tax=Micromonospora TaxID=1873 RepID=A0A136PXH2_9ACTN|nr:hypothetical protein [Micromonospora rosaria]KXK63181.1 hypothetical protein AWW66_04395 [Micromonospora rosaria]
MDQPLLAVLLLLGLLVGSGVGAAYTRARRGWTDYQAARRAVPGARRAAWLLIRAVTTKVGVITLLLAGAVAYAAVGSDADSGPGGADPAPTPSATTGAAPQR